MLAYKTHTPPKYINITNRGMQTYYARPGFRAQPSNNNILKS